MSNACIYKKSKEKSNAYNTIWVGSCKSEITTETGNYGHVYKPTFNFCPNCGKRLEVE